MVTPIRDVLKATVGRWGLGGLSWLVEVQRRWPAVVGPVLAAVSRPERVRGDALVVVASHSVAAQELRLRQRAILRALPGPGRAPRPARVLVVVRARLAGSRARGPARGAVRRQRGAREEAGTKRR